MKSFLEPKTIAIIGASRDENSVGYSLVKNLLDKKIYLINPNAKEILGIKTYSSILNVEEDIELAIVAVPAKIVPKVVDECGRKGTKNIIIISSGFSEVGNTELEDKLLRLKAKYNLRILGPNCLGVVTPHINASFAPSKCFDGNIAFVSQSGALIDAILDWSLKEKYGFSALVSIGNAIDIGFEDWLEYFDADLGTKVIALYIESLKDGRRFMNAAERISKPIVVIKSGKTSKARKASKFHTGRMTSPYDLYKYAFKQSGIIEVDSLEELFAVSKVLSVYPKTKNSVAVISNAGGACVLSVDYAERYGLKLADISKLKELDDFMPKIYNRRNPLDLVGDATSARYAHALKVLLEQENIHAILVIITPQNMTDVFNVAREVYNIQMDYSKPVLVCLMGGEKVRRAKEFLDNKDVPTFTDLRLACYALSKLVS